MQYTKIISALLIALCLAGKPALFGQITVTVTSTGDNTTVPVTGQLRWAIAQANAYTGGTTTIKFNLPISGTTPAVISLKAVLPAIVKTTVIDGTTQPGYQKGKPMVVVDGNLIPVSTTVAAFNFSAVSNSKILGLYIRNFYNGCVFSSSAVCEASYNVINQNIGSNILLQSSSECIIRGNFINTDVNLTKFAKNSEEGIFLSNDTKTGSSGNIIGGILCGEGNTIAYTNSEGIDNNPNAGASPLLNVSNTYTGNRIFGNRYDAIELRNAPNAANSNKASPVILTTGCVTTGTAEPNDTIELFGSEGPANSKKNANLYMKTVVADNNGNWTANFDFIEYPFITATARNSRRNTSELAPAKAITPSVLGFTFPPNACTRKALKFDNISTTCSNGFTFQWDFGDNSGVSNTGTHTYTAPGAYDVKLTMLPAIYCKTYSVTQKIIVKNCCDSCTILDFIVPAICIKDTVKFINTSVCPGIQQSFTWNFGDNTPVSSTGTHVYTAAGTYTVKLTRASSPECPAQSITKSVTVLECIQDCINCIGSFSPDSGTYVLGAWVREDINDPNVLTYTKPKIYINFPTNGNPSGPFSSPSPVPFTPEGRIIDGWQRIEGAFTIPKSATYINISLRCASGNCFFDDIRIFPVDGSMKSYVYDPVNLRLVAELDERNYATLYEYDEEGKLVRVKKETEKGVMTIKGNMNSTKKKQ